MKTNKKYLNLLAFGLLFLMGLVSANASSVITIINQLLCNLLQILWAVSAGIATLVIVIAGIKWIGSSEDAGARAQAKSTIIHAIIGLLIVMIALVLVSFVVSGGGGALSALTFSCD